MYRITRRVLEPHSITLLEIKGTSSPDANNHTNQTEKARGELGSNQTTLSATKSRKEVLDKRRERTQVTLQKREKELEEAKGMLKEAYDNRNPSRSKVFWSMDEALTIPAALWEGFGDFAMNIIHTTQRFHLKLGSMELSMRPEATPESASTQSRQWANDLAGIFLSPNIQRNLKDLIDGLNKTPEGGDTNMAPLAQKVVRDLGHHLMRPAFSTSADPLVIGVREALEAAKDVR